MMTVIFRSSIHVHLCVVIAFADMGKHSLIDDLKLKLYEEESTGWNEVLDLQVNELPRLKETLISSIPPAKKAEWKEAGKLQDFETQLDSQQTVMEELNRDVKMQRKRLREEVVSGSEDDIVSFCTHDILRQRIREVEKSYIDLKYNFINYVTAIL